MVQVFFVQGSWKFEVLIWWSWKFCFCLGERGGGVKKILWEKIICAYARDESSVRILVKKKTELGLEFHQVGHKGL